MWCTCDTVLHMGRMIQVRNVPEDVHRTLKARAAAEGMSLSDYIKRDLVRAASRPTFAELDARVRARPSSGLAPRTTVEAIRDLRAAG
jgi:plasmid stability protein